MYTMTTLQEWNTIHIQHMDILILLRGVSAESFFTDLNLNFGK